jgi:regulator of extracellular matrix RemA (YlzA/DUF370 family)
MKLLNVGFGNTVAIERIVAVINAGSSPSRKLKELAKEAGKLLDATEGRRTRSMLVTDSNHLILSSVQPDTIGQRLIALEMETHLAEYQQLQKQSRQEES